MLAAADGLLLEQLAAGDPADPRPALARLVEILIGTRS